MSTSWFFFASPPLGQRIAIHVSTDVELPLEDRLAAVASAAGFADRDSAALARADEELNDLRTQIILARALLPAVTVSRRQVRYIVEEARRGQCQGHRGELFAVRVAKASAALHGRTEVAPEDLRLAATLCLLPRSAALEQVEEERAPPPPAAQPQMPQPQGKDEDATEEEEEEEEQEDKNQPSTSEATPPSFLFAPEGVVLDPALLVAARSLRKQQGRAGRSRNKIYSQDRGRYVKPMFPKGKVESLGA